MQRGDQTTLVVAWLLPCGRAALRVTSALMLAGVLTLRVPSVSSVSNWDALLAPWAAALLESIATQIRHQRASVIGWLTDDFFNALESLTLLLLVGLGGCAAYDIITSSLRPPSSASHCRASPFSWRTQGFSKSPTFSQRPARSS